MRIGTMTETELLRELLAETNGAHFLESLKQAQFLSCALTVSRVSPGHATVLIM